MTAVAAPVGEHRSGTGLDGDWRVSRIGGTLPPMPLVRTAIRRSRGVGGRGPGRFRTTRLRGSDARR
jgi:hypothetical protein